MSAASGVSDNGGGGETFTLSASDVLKIKGRIHTYYPPAFASSSNIIFAKGQYRIVPITGKLAGGGWIISRKKSSRCCGLTEKGCPANAWANVNFATALNETLGLCSVCCAIGEFPCADGEDVTLVPVVTPEEYCDDTQATVSMGDSAFYDKLVEDEHISAHNVISTLLALYPNGNIEELMGKIAKEFDRLKTEGKVFPKDNRFLGTDNNRGSPYLLTPAGSWGLLNAKMDEYCPLIMEVINKICDDCDLNVMTVFLAYYFDKDTIKPHLKEELKLGPEKLDEVIKNMTFGFFDWHQDNGFGAADVRALLTTGSNKKGKKMMFICRKTDRWFQMEVPHGTIIIFSRTGGGVLEDSSIFHKIVDGDNTGTIAFEGWSKSKGCPPPTNTDEDAGIV